MDNVIKQLNEAEAEYLETGSAEAWADFLNISIKIAEIERGNRNG